MPETLSRRVRIVMVSSYNYVAEQQDMLPEIIASVIFSNPE